MTQMKTAYILCKAKTNRPNKALALKIARMLFEGKFGVASRLALEGPRGENLGGWALQPAADRIEEVLDKERKSNGH